MNCTNTTFQTFFTSVESGSDGNPSEFQDLHTQIDDLRKQVKDLSAAKTKLEETSQATTKQVIIRRFQLSHAYSYVYLQM